jgi:hypothetical protein
MAASCSFKTSERKKGGKEKGDRHLFQAMHSTPRIEAYGSRLLRSSGRV